MSNVPLNEVVETLAAMIQAVGVSSSFSKETEKNLDKTETCFA